MANVIITLPRVLWWAIEKGQKMYEIRKRIPNLVLGKTKIFVVGKGTTKILGYFTLDGFLMSNDPYFLYKQIGKKIWVDFQWYDKYVQNHKGKIYAWKIREVYKCEDTVDLEEYFGVNKNPQSYIYTDRDPFLHTRLVKILDPERGRLVSPSTFWKTYDKDDLPF